MRAIIVWPYWPNRTLFFDLLAIGNDENFLFWDVKNKTLLASLCATLIDGTIFKQRTFHFHF